MADRDSIGDMFEAQRKAALAFRQSDSLKERRSRLDTLKRALDLHGPRILAAIEHDMGKCASEATLWELLPLRLEIAHARSHLRRWMRPRRVAPTVPLLGTSGRVVPTPKGVVLIIGPWNFPLLLTIGPLVSALAAGNCAILKPSDLTPATSAALAAMMAEHFAPDIVAVAEGGAETAEALLDLPFDHVFFTGSGAVGRKVMARAAQQLSPVTLELGGKSPVIVSQDADIARAARWIAWGRFANCGQTCVAPDHVYVHRSAEAALTEALRSEIARAYGATAQAQMTSPDYARIINDRHYRRLCTLLDEALAAGAKFAAGGERDEATRFLAPTLLTGTTAAMSVSREEIFGPILPLIPYDDISEPVASINAGPRPLALYAFGRNRIDLARLKRETRSGGMGINLAVVQFVHPNLPFGGIGASGIGAAHGQAGFETFTHMRPVLTNRFALFPLVFPPYGWLARWTARAVGWLAR